MNTVIKVALLYLKAKLFNCSCEMAIINGNRTANIQSRDPLDGIFGSLLGEWNKSGSKLSGSLSGSLQPEPEKHIKNS